MGQRTDPPFAFKIDQRRGRREATKTVSHLSRAIDFDHITLVLSEKKEKGKCQLGER
jgi:hypothetical protein